MFARIDDSELGWFKGRLFRRHAHYVPPGYERQIVLLHPRSHVDQNAEFVPVVGHAGDEGEPWRSPTTDAHLK